MELQNETKPITEGTETVPQRTAKDSVFCDLFQDPENLLELYRCLHPEDTAAAVEDLGNVTLRNILVEDQYNDLGFTIRDRQLILLEAQSTWSANIVLRILLYLADTWNAHIVKYRCNLYGTKPPLLPKPELYVLYTGRRRERPEWISLADTLFGGDSTYLDVRVRMLYGDGSVNGILNQYVVFTEIIDEQIRIHGRTQKAVEETIRLCRQAGALEKYLTSHEREVIRIMTTLFSQEYVTEAYGEEKLQEGRAEGRLDEKKETAFRLKAMGSDNSFIASVLDISLSIVQGWFADASEVST